MLKSRTLNKEFGPFHFIWYKYQIAGLARQKSTNNVLATIDDIHTFWQLLERL